eukprot:COSAG02_NODE_1363_length_13047_cov_5.747374_8_plen_145_part_00
MQWSQIVRAEGWYATYRPSADKLFCLDLSVSDSNKPLLLKGRVIPYLVDALLLEPTHPRASMTEEQRSWCQTYHVECIAQLAMFEPAAEALRQETSAVSALQRVAEAGLTSEARQFAEAALLALSDTELCASTEGDKHVMLSCE